MIVWLWKMKEKNRILERLKQKWYVWIFR
jgi:hypothetical protein